MASLSESAEHIAASQFSQQSPTCSNVPTRKEPQKEPQTAVLPEQEMRLKDLEETVKKSQRSPFFTSFDVMDFDEDDNEEESEESEEDIINIERPQGTSVSAVSAGNS
ncbi:hypothetical protein H0H92_000265 [Tricholoma furcatifolium]|nr:hypothetical protein H0H92_000265 [Tricholoma furcatifolium]